MKVRKFEIHLDAIAVLVLLFLSMVVFIVYQHKASQALFQQNIDLQFELQNLQANKVLQTAELKKCRAVAGGDHQISANKG